MASSVAPWLQGLDEAWEEPAGITGSQQVSSATHDASSLRSIGSTRIHSRSPSGQPNSLSSQKTSSNATTQIKRSPLAQLSHTNTLRRPHHSVEQPGSRSVSRESGGSILQGGTVQQRSKSTSPVKTQQTLEWKRRLVNGQVGYGDQTDLFGPSGLENIFARSNGAEDAPKAKNRMAWLQKSDVPMPSSPPPWPSNLVDGDMPERLEPVDEEEHGGSDADYGEGAEGSLKSNPYDSGNPDQFEEDSQSVIGPPSSGDAYDEPARVDATVNRTISGQTDLEQEDFSPVFISKHTTVNGRVGYTALDSHLVKQFQSGNGDLRDPNRDGSAGSNQDDETIEPSGFTDDLHSEDESQVDVLPAAPDLSLSENLPTGTPPVANLDRNVEFKRGGYSAYGSFKHRPLSPSPTKTDESTPHMNRSLLVPVHAQGRPLPAVPSPSQGRTTPLRPTTPDPPRSRPAGSPLKLFGPHDTFTSNRLLRRLSQLDPEGNTIKEDTEPIQHQPAPVREVKRVISTASSHNSFGSGQLDTHAFRAEITITGASDSGEDDSLGSPGSEIPAPGSRDPHTFRMEPSAEVKDTFNLKRKLSRQSAAKSSKHSTLEGPQKEADSVDATAKDEFEHNPSHLTAAESIKIYDGGKRPPTSPFKNPTPKRRRTLHASELALDLANANQTYHVQLKVAASTRDPNDARPSESHATVTSEVYASRKIMRPRNPTPNQHRRQQIQAELRKATDAFAAQEPEKLEAVMEQLESSFAGSDGPQTLREQAEAVAAEVANFTLRIHKPSGEHGTRKRSVTTQDFYDEALMVMQMIRAKARPQSHLGSVEESDEGASSLNADGSLVEAGGSLRVSRPPSREGGHSGWRSGVQSQVDARVVSHLRRFQERDDTEFIAESIRSLRVDDEESVNDNVIVIDDEVSNIRITGPLPEVRRKNDASDESRPTTQGSQGSTLHTQQSAGTSTGRSIATSSTRKSENVGTLAPDAVAHLIGEQVGAMTFDKETQRWVRVKSPERKGPAVDLLEPPSQLTSDDDPFREISDLPVDAQEELRRASFGTIERDEVNIDETISVHDQELEGQAKNYQPSVESRVNSTETVLARPSTRDSSHMRSRIHHAHSSSVPSRYTAFASSQQDKVETRATSWGDEEMARMAVMEKARQQPLAYAAAQATLALRGECDRVVEESETDSAEYATLQMDDLVNDQTTEELRPTSMDGLREDTVLDKIEPDIGPIASIKLRQTPLRKASALTTTYQGPARQMSLRQKTLTNRYHSEAHEQSELSFVAALPGERMMSVQLSVSRPLAPRQPHQHLAVADSSPSKADPYATFLMSEMPDFTLHETDEERSSERALTTRLAQHAAAEANDRYAVARKCLVKTLTDVHEDEPYWEDLKQLDLHDRSLASLYGLDDFCTRVQDLDVSNNALAHLEGTPVSVRRLVARANQLTTLTCWGHLVNLQYLDVSGNQLDSLMGLAGLVHLRELCADDNMIRGLEGVMELDGLLKLRLRKNKIQQVDFAGAQLQRLVCLDLSDNESCAVQGLEELSALEELKLDGTFLGEGLQIREQMPQLKSLSLRGCGLERLNVSMLPNLRTLDVDDNRLADVEGVANLKSIELISMRRQTLPEGVGIAIFNHPMEARTIRLSGNTIPHLPLSTSFLNLQHLELASVGLQDLPDDFGLRMPNLRVLNLNFNVLRDIRPLLNIQRLEQLSICGNRLGRLRKSVATLAKLRSMKSLDLRDNAVTQGFYPPATTGQTSIVRRALPAVAADEDQQTEKMELASHHLPAGDSQQDQQHQTRMDEDTKLRRRVYELLLAHSCGLLEELDGLRFDKLAANVRDRTWERLVELGVVKKSHTAVPVLMAAAAS